MKNFIIDIILPIYKPNEQVYKTINSVLSQSYTNWHLYIIDDSSMDNSLNEIKENYKSYSNRITYFQFTQNQRAAGCRNYAISHSKGEFVAFLDQDDIWMPNKLEKQIKEITNKKASAIHTNICFIDVDDNYIKLKQAEKENSFRNNINWDTIGLSQLTKTMFEGTYIRLVSSMLSRKAFMDVGGFDATLFGGEEWEFWVRFSHQYKISHLQDALIKRRVSNLNTSSVYKFERQINKLEALDKMKSANYISEKNIVNKKRYSIYKSIIFSGKGKDSIKSTKMVFSHIFKHPFQLVFNSKLLANLLFKVTSSFFQK